jgi:hypothetical protein
MEIKIKDLFMVKIKTFFVLLMFLALAPELINFNQPGFILEMDYILWSEIRVAASKQHLALIIKHTHMFLATTLENIIIDHSSIQNAPILSPTER